MKIFYLSSSLEELLADPEYPASWWDDWVPSLDTLSSSPQTCDPACDSVTVFAAVGTFELLVSFVTYSAMNILLRLLNPLTRLDDINPPIVLHTFGSNTVGLLLLNIDGRLVQSLDVGFNSHRLDQPIFYFF